MHPLELVLQGCLGDIIQLLCCQQRDLSVAEAIDCCPGQDTPAARPCIISKPPTVYEGCASAATHFPCQARMNTCRQTPPGPSAISLPSPTLLLSLAHAVQSARCVNILSMHHRANKKQTCSQMQNVQLRAVKKLSPVASLWHNPRQSLVSSCNG